MKIVDSFMFFDENMLLDLRLNILDKYVAKFIICEATFNHNGESKKLNFDMKNFSKFKSKIEYVILDKQPDNLRIINKNDDEKIKESKILDNALIRENFQRNFTHSKLKDCLDNDLILINDLDEIPNLVNFKYQNKITIFKQKMLYFKFNLIYPEISWSGSKICKMRDFVNPQWLRNIKTRKYPIWRFDILFSQKKYNKIQIIENGGWHFTNIKTPEQIFEKLKNFGHHDEFELAKINVNQIREKIENKEVFYNHLADKNSKDRWNDNYKLKKVNLDCLPKYLIKNSEKFKEWID